MAEFLHIEVVDRAGDVWVDTAHWYDTGLLPSGTRKALRTGEMILVEVKRPEYNFDDGAYCGDITKVYSTAAKPKGRATKMTETIEVKAVGPYGVRVNDEWYKFGKGISGDQFSRGGRYQVTTFAGQKGGKYIKSVVLGTTGSPAPLDPGINANTPPLNTHEDLKSMAAAAGVPMKFGKPMSAYEIETEQRIRRSGVVQAAAQCPALTQVVTDGNPETLKAAIRDLAQDMLNWVEDKQIKAEVKEAA